MLIVKPVTFCTSDEKLQRKKVQINIIIYVFSVCADSAKTAEHRETSPELSFKAMLLSPKACLVCLALGIVKGSFPFRVQCCLNCH